MIVFFKLLLRKVINGIIEKYIKTKKIHNYKVTLADMWKVHSLQQFFSETIKLTSGSTVMSTVSMFSVIIKFGFEEVCHFSNSCSV